MAKSTITFNIDVLLLQKGISKAKFYKDCNITSATYSQWNTGKTKPKLATLERVADYLGVPLTYILTKGIAADGTMLLAEVDSDEKTPAAEENEKEKLMAAIDTMSREELLDFIAQATEVLREK